LRWCAQWARSGDEALGVSLLDVTVSETAGDIRHETASRISEAGAPSSGMPAS